MENRPERDARCWKRPAEEPAGTTPEPPGRTGPGPPVTEDTSDGQSRKQGGTVEISSPLDLQG